MEGYVFILNLRDVTVELPQEIIPSHYLDRASADEALSIKTALEHFRAGRARLQSPYEHDWRVESAPHGRRFLATPLPMDRWRYFVVRFSGPVVAYNKIGTASLLSNAEFQLGPAIFPGYGPDGVDGLGHHPETMFRFMDGGPSEWMADFVTITLADVEQLRERCRQIELHRNDVLDLTKRLNDLHQLRLLERSSPLAFLGYFAMIESVLTHQPKQSDPYDSVTRQVKSKLALLSNRFDAPIDYSVFGAAKPETVWGALYDYRSKIAHGAQPDFSNKLKLLKSHEFALSFVKSVTRTLLTHVLKEPELVRDLQQC